MCYILSDCNEAVLKFTDTIKPISDYFLSYGRLEDYITQTENDSDKLYFELAQKWHKTPISLVERLETIHHHYAIHSHQADVLYVTVHQAKGVMFDRVWVAHDFISVMPSPSKQEQQELRLLYIAMTRAKEQLFIQG